MNNNSKTPKSLNKVAKFFKGIYRVIDKIVITPIAKLFIKVLDILKHNGKFLEGMLNHKVFLIVLSLIFAFITFVVVDQQTNIFINKSADVLYNQEVKAIYNEEAYVVEGIPEKVDITLIGRKADLYLAKQFTSNNVTIDLSGLKPGSHKVSLKYTKAVSSVDYKIDPSSVTVVIYEKVSESRSVSTEILHKDGLNSKYQINSIKISKEEVFVKGAQYKLDQVAVVKALVDIKDITNPKVGTVAMKDIPLVAYDSNGNKLDVETVPSKIEANVEITSPSKDVPLKVIPDGEVVFGKAINDMILSTKTVTIYAEQDVLESITYLPVKINVTDISKTTSFNVNLSKPSGVRDMSTSSVTVKVTLDNSVDSEIKGVTLITKNLANGYVANALGEINSKVDITIKGTKSAINSLDKSTVVPYVDLSGLGEGTYPVEVKVTGDDLRLKYDSKTKTVKIIIQKEK